MRAVQLVEWKSDPAVVDVPVPAPAPGQVLVRIGGAGVCHSDLHIMHDFDGSMFGWDLPFTLGHENAGWVHAVGDGVVGLEIGQAVAVFGAWGCGACAFCRQGLETLCERPQDALVPAGGAGGLGYDGGMAEYMLVPFARLVVPLPDGLAPVLAASLTDAGLTPYRAVRRSWPKLAPGATAVVVGVGGLGHLAVQILTATTAARVIAVDRRPEALALAEECGAWLTLTPDEAEAGIRTATGGRGADVVLDFVGVDATLALGYSVLRHLGDLTICGIGGGTLPVTYFTLAKDASVQTSHWGSRPELAEVLDLGARGLLEPKLTVFDIEHAPDAYRALEEGRITGRAVVVPAPA
jgi:propanol-preferring alcohol dehydrogenase